MSEYNCEYCDDDYISSMKDCLEEKMKHTDVLDFGFVELVDCMPQQNGDQRIVEAARVSIAGEGVRPTSDNKKLIRYLLKNEHWTPFETPRFTFRVKCPIFIARQWMRHRACSYNEISARYGQLPNEFYVPSIERLMNGGQAKDNKQGSGLPISREVATTIRKNIELANIDAYDTYQYLLDEGLARELARAVLPVSIYTQFYWTIDLRNLMNFLKLRLHEHAQWEIREYAQAILPMAEELCPLAMEAFRDFILRRPV